MKNQNFCIIALTTLCFSLIFLPITDSSATIIWQEDFESGLDGWTTFGWNRTDGSPLPSNFSVMDGVLRINGTFPQESAAEHPSTQTTGTWSFDLDVTYTVNGHCHIDFFGKKMGNLSEVDNFTDAFPYAYGIMVVTEPSGMWDSEFVFYKREEGSPTIIPLNRYAPSQILGWHHFDITKTSEGEFNIFINGTYCKSYKDTAFSISEVFRFSGPPGHAIDNIVVRDDILLTPPTTTTSETTTTTTEPASMITAPLFLIFFGIIVINQKRKK